MSEIQIKCAYSKLLPIEGLKPHPKNRNTHSKDQITRLSELIAYQGVRHPVIISNLTGFIVAGHARVMALKKLKVKDVPCDFQDFADETVEYAFVQSDNAIAEWAELDLSTINMDLADLGPDFNIDMLGIENFTLDVADKDIEINEKEIDENIHTDKECPSCGYKWS